MSRRYRIAIVTRTFPPKSGGIASAHYNLYELLRADHEVRAFAFDDDDPTPCPDAVRRTSPRWLAEPLAWALGRWVRRYDRSHPAVYCPAIARAIPAARALGRPLRRFAPDIVIVPDNYVPGLALPIPPGASTIWMSRNNFRRFENQPLVHQRSWMDIHLAHRLELRALRKADAVVCPSKYMARVFGETYGVDLPVHVIYNFVHPTTLGAVKPADLRSELGLSSDVRMVYIPSGGTSIKGKRYVFEIVRRLGARGGVGFYVPGPVERDLAREIESLDGRIPVHLPGQVPYRENLRYVAACDLAVSPTLIENLSNAIVEGLMLGVPFVTFDTGGNAEIVHSGVNGFVVPYLDVEGLVARASELLDDPALLDHLQARAREPLEPLVDPSRIRSQYREVFDALRGGTGTAVCAAAPI